MSRKLKFKPEITRVKLNPEQAVLVCDCYTSNLRVTIGSGTTKYYAAELGGICSGRTEYGSGHGSYGTQSGSGSSS